MTETTNTVQLVIQASDKANDILGRSREVLVSTGAAAIVVKNSFVSLSSSIVSLGGQALNKLNDLRGGISLIQKLLKTETAQGFIESIKEQAQEAVNETQSLTTLLGSLTVTSTPFLEGFILGPPGNVEAKARKVGDNVANTLVKAITGQGSSLSAAISNAIEPGLLGIEQSFGGIGEAAAGAIRGATGNLTSIVDAGLSQGLSFGLNKFVDSKLPPFLQVFGGSISSTIVAFLPAGLRTALQGSVLKGIGVLVSDQVTVGIIDAVTTLDAKSLGSVDFFRELGEKLFLEPELFSQKAKKLLDNLFNNLGDIGKFGRGLLAPIENEVLRLADDLQKIVREKIFVGFKEIAFGSALKPFRDAFISLFSTLDQGSEGLLSEVGTRTGGRLGVAFAQGFLSKALTPLGNIANSLDATILRTVSFLEKTPQKLSSTFGQIGDLFGKVAGTDEPLSVFADLQRLAGGFAGTVSKVSEQIFFFTSGFEALKGLVLGGPFNILIDQNVKLREQLLATQSTLAATNNIIQNGSKIVDPTAAIQALQGPVEQAVKQLRQGSLELVGVTSKDLIESFQIIAGQAGAIGINLTQSKDLTLSFAAALGTLGVPLAQARQEITSILTGTIDMNSVVAKSLGITNQQVATWKSQNRLIDELNVRLEAFRAGNKLASQTLGGVSSNIQEIVDEIGRLAGEQLLDPIVKQLTELYNYLLKNKDAIAENVGTLVGLLLQMGQSVVSIFQNVFSSTQGIISKIPEYLFKSAANALTELANAISTTLTILQPAINLFAKLAENAGALAGPFLALFIQFKVLQTGIKTLAGGFGTLGQVLPGVGELLFLLSGRTNSMINTFASLTSSVGRGGAAFLLLGQNLSAIPGAAGIVASKLGPLGPLLTGLIPSMAGIGIQAVGLAKAFPQVGTVLTSLAAQAPNVISTLAGVADSSQVAGGAFKAFAPALQQASKELATYTRNTDIATLLNQKFAEIAKEAGLAVRNQIISFGLLAAGVFATFYILDNFVLKNQAVMEAIGGVVEGLKEFAGVIKDALLGPLGLAVIALGGLTLAYFNYGKAIAFVKTLEIAGIFSKAIPFVLNLGRAMVSMGLATGGGAAAITALEGAMATGTVTAGTFAAALYAVVAPLAIIAAGIAAIGLIRYTKALADSTAATEELGRQADQTSQSTLEFANKLKAAKQRQDEANEKGVRLAKEEYQQNAELQKQAANRLVLLDEEIKKQKSAISTIYGDDNKRAIQGRIDQLEKLKETIKSLQSGVDITPKDLPRLGQAFEQLQLQAQGAIDAINNPSGDTAKIDDQAKKLIDSTQKQLELGQITTTDAISRYELIATKAGISAENQVTALKGITDVAEIENQRQVKNSESKVAQIETAIANQQTTEIEGAAEVTAAKLEQLNQQLEDAKASQKKQLEVEQKATQDTLAELDKQLLAAQQKKAAASGDKGQATALAEQAIAQLTPQKEAITQQINEVTDQIQKLKAQVPVGGRGKVREEVKQQLDEAENKLSGLRTNLDTVDKQLTEQQNRRDNPPGPNQKAIDAADREINGINKKKEEATKASNARIGLINDNFRNTEAKTESEKAKLAQDLARKEFDKRIEDLDRGQRKYLDKEKQAELERQVQIQQLQNLGLLTKAQAEAQQADLTKGRIKAELQAEELKVKELQKLKPADEKSAKQLEDDIRASKLKTLDLTRQALEQEDKLYEAHLGVLREQLTKQSEAYANELEEQNQILARQGQLYEMLSKSLDQRNQLLQASRDLLSGTSDYLTQEIDILAKGESSDTRRARLAETAAAIKLQSAKQMVELEREQMKIQLEQNRIALERKDIENETAIAKKAVELEKGKADITIAGKQLEKGKISKEEYDRTILDQRQRQIEFQSLQRERGLIQREKELQPVQEALLQQSKELEFRRSIRAAQAEFAGSAKSEAEQRRRYKALGNEFAGEYGMSRADIIQMFRNQTRAISNKEFYNQGEGSDLFLKLSPNFRRLFQQASDAAQGTAAPGDLEKVRLPGVAEAIERQQKRINETVGKGIAVPSLEDLTGRGPGFAPADLKSIQPLTKMQTTLQQQGNSILSQISQAMATNNQLLSKIADGSSSGVGSNLEKQAGNIINITIPSQGSDRANAIATRNEVLNQLSNISQRTKQKVSAQN